MKPNLLILFTIPLILLTGCLHQPLTWDQQLSIYKTKCMDFGFEPGTVEFSECVQNQDQQAIEQAERERDRKNRAAIAQKNRYPRKKRR